MWYESSCKGTTEMIGESRGLGYYISYASASFEYATAFAGVAAVAIIGFTLDRLLVWLRNRLIFWERGAAFIGAAFKKMKSKRKQDASNFFPRRTASRTGCRGTTMPTTWNACARPCSWLLHTKSIWPMSKRGRREKESTLNF